MLTLVMKTNIRDGEHDREVRFDDPADSLELGRERTKDHCSIVAGQNVVDLEAYSLDHGARIIKEIGDRGPAGLFPDPRQNVGIDRCFPLHILAEQRGVCGRQGLVRPSSLRRTAEMIRGNTRDWPRSSRGNRESSSWSLASYVEAVRVFIPFPLPRTGRTFCVAPTRSPYRRETVVNCSWTSERRNDSERRCLSLASCKREQGDEPGDTILALPPRPFRLAIIS